MAFRQLQARACTESWDCLGFGSSSMSLDYRSTWQRWQTMTVLPGFAQRRERLQRAEAEPGSAPSAEALDFFEALLATEPRDQLRQGARRLEAQAAALRSRRSAPLPAPEETEDFAARAVARREAHEQRLREVEAQAAAEQAELQAEIEREQTEAQARREAQQAWLEELARTQKAERERAKAKAYGPADGDWRKRWWHYVPRPEPGPKPKPPPNGRSRRWEPPESEMLQELRSKQDEPLEVRKKIWRSLCLRWHPDKSEDKDLATKAFQQLSELKPWFLPEAC